MADIASIGLEIKSRGLQTGINRMRDLEREGGRTERTMRRVGGAATAMGAAIVAAAGGASFARIIRETASFEDAMLGLQAVSGATEQQMQALEQQARTLGATSMFSAQQAGEAQRFLAMAGFEVNEVLSATPGILNLATAASIDLGRAADIASNVLGGFQLNVSELSRVNDVLAATAAGSNTSIEQLGDALSYAAPIAAAAGVSIEETAAAIGTLSDSGLQASRAGTGILGFIRQLSNLTPDATSALESYGLTAAQVNVENEGLSTVLERLRQANINTADSFRIFGSEAGPAAQILAAGAQRVDEFTGSLRNAEGAAERAALIIGSGLTGSMRGFNSMVSESILQLGESGLAGAFGSVVDQATGVLAVYNDMLPQFAEANNLTDEQAQNFQRLADLLRITVTVAGAATAAFVAYRGAVIAATIAQTGFNVAVRANPLGLLATGVGAAAGALWSFREELGLVDEPVKSGADSILELSNRVDGASDAMLKFEVAGFTAELVSLRTAAGQAESSIAAMQQRLESGGLTGDQEDQLTQSIERQQRGLSQLNAEIEGRVFAIDALNTRLALLSANEGQGTSTTNTNTSATRANAAAKREAAREAEQFATALQNLQDQLFPVEAANRRYREQQETLNRALAEGTISADRYAEAMERLDEAQLSSRTAQQTYGSIFDPTRGPQETANPWQEWLSSAESAFTNFDEMNAEVARNFTSNFGNMFADVIFQQSSFKDGFQSMMQGLARSVVTAIGEMIAQWLAYQAVTAAIGFFGGGGVGGLFAGFFDKGGRIPSGQWGIAGEIGPELVRGPAQVTSRRETAQMMQGGGVTVNVNNAPPGTQVNERMMDGKQIIDVFVADMSSNGRSAKALQSNFGLQRQGR